MLEPTISELFSMPSSTSSISEGVGGRLSSGARETPGSQMPEVEPGGVSVVSELVSPVAGSAGDIGEFGDTGERVMARRDVAGELREGWWLLWK